MRLPPRFVRGQPLTADQLNGIVEAIRRARPLPGAGVSTRESPDGTFISAAAQKQSTAPTFDHRFKVTYAAAAGGGYDLKVRKGSLWRVAGGVAAEQPLLLGEGIAQHPTDADAWQVAGASAGALYVSQSTAEDGEPPVYMLGYAAIPVTPLAVIAEFTPSQSSSNPAPKVTQRQLGDLLVFEGGEAATAALPPAAWQVRRAAFTEETPSGEVTTRKWQLFSPLWAVGRETLLPAGMARGWNDLPDALASGTLYAALTWVGTATVDDAGAETVSWTPSTPIVTNSLADVPPDDDPSGARTSSATPGHRSVVVEIGDFREPEDPDTGTDDAGGDPPEAAFRQAHLGVIVENLAQGASSGGQGLQLGPLTYVSYPTRKFVRYLGQWAYDEETGAWAFAAALKPDGTQYPAAEEIPAREMLIRINGDIYVAYRPDIGPTPTRWLSKRTATLSTGVAYSPPADEDSTGRLYETTATLTYYSDVAQQDGNEVDLIYTQVEAANEGAHFEA